MIAATTATTAAATAQQPRLAQDFDTFLTLLTTQLRNQSPTDPLNANEMTAQLVQFASVEQQILANRTMERLVEMQASSQMLAAVPMLGATVEIEGDALSLQDGQASLRIPRAAGVEEVRIAIRDTSGRLLREETARTEGRDLLWQWDGRDSTGRTLADGAYRVSVLGAAPGEAAAAVPFRVVGRVTGLDQQDGQVALALGRVTTTLDRVRSVEGAGR
jgi:flagellar basal-body rod modification protein FlgD